VAYALSDEMEVVDLGWPWRSLTTSTVGYSSDSWASCCNLKHRRSHSGTISSIGRAAVALRYIFCCWIWRKGRGTLWWKDDCDVSLVRCSELKQRRKSRVPDSATRCRYQCSWRSFIRFYMLVGNIIFFDNPIDFSLSFRCSTLLRLCTKN